MGAEKTARMVGAQKAMASKDLKAFLPTEDMMSEFERRDLRNPNRVHVTISANGYVGCEFSSPALEGETWRRGGDGPDGKGQRAFDMVMRFVELFRENPDRSGYDIKDQVYDEFADTQ